VTVTERIEQARQVIEVTQRCLGGLPRELALLEAWIKVWDAQGAFDPYHADQLLKKSGL